MWQLPARVRYSVVIPDQIAAVTKEANLLGAAVTCNDARRLISTAAHDLQTHDDWHAGRSQIPAAGSSIAVHASSQRGDHLFYHTGRYLSLLVNKTY